MLENFIFSANAVFPIFIVIAFGFFLRQKQFISASGIGEMNRLVFTFALPMLLFSNVYRADFTALVDPLFIFWILGSIIVSFALLWIFAEIYLRKQKALIGAFVQATLRSNYAIVGLPLVANIMEGQVIGMGAFAAAFVVIIYNVFSVVILTAKDSRNGAINAALIKNMAIGICKNPPIIGIICGVAVNLLNIELPAIAAAGVHYMAVLCTPMALIAVGGSIQVSELKGYLKVAVTASVIKIVVTPVIFMTISVWLGFRGEALAVLFVLFANPTAIICYVMAARMNGNTAVTSATILITTVFSSVTLTIGVYLLRSLALV